MDRFCSLSPASPDRGEAKNERIWNGDRNERPFGDSALMLKSIRAQFEREKTFQIDQGETASEKFWRLASQNYAW
jgi:hypothetical protein